MAVPARGLELVAYSAHAVAERGECMVVARGLPWLGREEGRSPCFLCSSDVGGLSTQHGDSSSRASAAALAAVEGLCSRTAAHSGGPRESMCPP